MTYQRPTQPSGIIEVLGAGFRLFRAAIRSLYVPVFCLLLVIGLIQWGQIPYPHVEERVTLGVGDWLRMLAFLLVSIFMSGVIFAMVHYIASGAPSGVRSPIAIATHRYPTLLAISVLCGLAISIGPLALALLMGLLAALGLLALGPYAIYVGVLLMFVPMIYLAVALFACLIIAVAEGHGPVDSLRESFALVRGRWWRTFALIAIVTGAVTSISLGINQIILFLADGFESKPIANTVSTLIYAAFHGIIWSLSSCLIYGVYQDLRLRLDNGAPST